MKFINSIPDWKNEGAEPQKELLESGFQVGYKPPASIFNWFWSLITKGIKEIQQVVESHTNSVGDDTTAGHVTLSDSLTDTSGVTDGTAATPAAIKAVNDKVENIDLSGYATKEEIDKKVDNATETGGFVAGKGASEGSFTNVAIGNSAYAGDSGIALGTNARGTQFGISIGYDTETASHGIAIGYGAKAGSGGIQLGAGENNGPWGIKVFDYQLLDQYGNIPIERLKTLFDYFTQKNYVTYGVKVDLNNSDPSAAVEYTCDAIGMNAGEDWNKEQIFKSIKPCVLKDGVVQYYLNPNNLTLKEDGSPADIVSGNDGDVMVEIPKIGIKLYSDENSNYLQITDEPDKEGFSYLSHSLESEGDCDKIYVSAYFGTVENKKLRSLSGKMPTNQYSLDGFRTAAAARNTAGSKAYQLCSYYVMSLIKALFLIKYKNLNSQKALGLGYVGGEWNKDGRTITGGTNTLGIDYGDRWNNKVQVCFLNIEDLWGNMEMICEGSRMGEDNQMQLWYKDFWGSTPYISFEHIAQDNDLKATIWTNEAPFLYKNTDETTVNDYGTVYTALKSGNILTTGGKWYIGNLGSLFGTWSVQNASSSSEAGARLVYKHKKV